MGDYDKPLERARREIADLAEADGEITFAREVRAGTWDSRGDIQSRRRCYAAELKAAKKTVSK